MRMPRSALTLPLRASAALVRSEDFSSVANLLTADRPYGRVEAIRFPVVMEKFLTLRGSTRASAPCYPSSGLTSVEYPLPPAGPRRHSGRTLRAQCASVDRSLAP